MNPGDRGNRRLIAEIEDRESPRKGSERIQSFEIDSEVSPQAAGVSDEFNWIGFYDYEKGAVIESRNTAIHERRKYLKVDAEEFLSDGPPRRWWSMFKLNS